MKKTLLSAVLLLVLSGCSSSNENTDSKLQDLGYGYNGNGEVNENLKIDQTYLPAPEGWILLDQGDFTLYAPKGWSLTPEQGIDSAVGIVSGDGVTLSYDYGNFSAPLSNDSTFDVNEYEVEEVQINGFSAIIYTPKLKGQGVVSVHFASPRGEGSLNLSGENLSDDHEAIVLELFKTIFFKQ